MEDTQYWRKLNEIFQHAIDLDSSDRAKYLDQACKEDDRLRTEVEDLLARDANDSRFTSPLEHNYRELIPDSRLVNGRIGSRIGDYEILSRIGSGGSGVVYRARKAGHPDQDVAIKVLHPILAADGKARTRFLLESDYLAQLDHPFICRLLDRGETEERLPYLVTELVEGEPITRFCDEKKLPIRERLELFQKVSEGVAHAQQLGLIHRDLKPSNILVTDSAEPKILDFGIAKALPQSEGDAALQLTASHQTPLTPWYASPEQLEGKSVTLGTDVYSLGIILCELLTGVHPHGTESRNLIQRFRAVADGVITPPSEVVVGMQPKGNRQATEWGEAFTNRATDEQTLVRTLRGDLDLIVTTSIQPEPVRRYATAQELAGDIGNYLDGRPLYAQRESLAYLIAKKIRQRRAALIAWTLALAALGMLTVTTVARQRAEAESHASRKRAYMLAINDGFDALADHNLRVTRRILEEQTPLEDQIDTRNFAWQFLKYLVEENDRGTVFLPSRAQSVVTPDNKYLVLIHPSDRKLASAHHLGSQEDRAESHRTELTAVDFVKVYSLPAIQLIETIEIEIPADYELGSKKAVVASNDARRIALRYPRSTRRRRAESTSRSTGRLRERVCPTARYRVGKHSGPIQDYSRWKAIGIYLPRSAGSSPEGC